MRQEIDYVVQTLTGDAVVGAAVQVNLRNVDGTSGAAAVVYSTPDTGSTLSNPLTTGASGRIDGWLGLGLYNLEISGPGIVAYTQAFDVLGFGSQGFLNVKDPPFNAKGDGVTDDYQAFVNAYNALPVNGGEILVPPGIYLTSATLVISKPVRLIGAGIHSGANKATSVIRPAAGVTGIQINNSQGTTSRFEGLVLWSRSSGAGTDNGFTNHAHGVVWDQVLVQGFGQDGVANDTTTGGNCNNWSARNLRVVGCFRHGMMNDGVDSNAGSAFDCEFSNNGGWGIWDESFLGNAYFGCLTEGNGLGGTHDEPSGVNACRYYAHYTEMGQGSGNDINHPSIIFGPEGSSTNIGDAPGIGSTLGRLLSTKAIEVQDSSGTVFTRLGYPQGGSGILEFDKTGEGAYYLQFGNSGFEFRESNLSARTAFALTGTNDSAGPGFARMPRGFFMTGSTTLGATNPARKYVGNSDAAPTTGTWNRGDILYNTAPSASGKVGWVCTTGGTPGTWKAFGDIDP